MLAASVLDTVYLDAAVNEDHDRAFISDLTAALHKVGVKYLRFCEPTFVRVDGREIHYRPKTVEEFDALKYLSRENLRKIGCKLWDDFGGSRHWLYPPEWYGNVPDGYTLLFTDGHKESFSYGQTTRLLEIGGLSFGFVQHDDS